MPVRRTAGRSGWCRAVAGLRDAVAGFRGESDAELAAVLRLLSRSLYHLNKPNGALRRLDLT